MYLRIAISFAIFGFFFQLSSAVKASFDGYQVFRIDVAHDTNRESQFQGLPIIQLGHSYGRSGVTLDIAVPPDYLAAFDARNFNATLLSDNLGADISNEGPLGPYPGMNFDDVVCAISPVLTFYSEYDQDGIPELSWFDSYQ